jgi:Tol biopolymer transport system component
MPTFTPAPPPPTPGSPTPTHTPLLPTPEPTEPPALRGRIVFTRNPYGHQDSTHEIYLLDLDTGSVTRLMNNSFADWDPSWAPDGQWIAYVSWERGNHDIWEMRADGSGKTPRITLDAWDDYPDWAPDGSRLVITSSGVTQGVPNAEIFVAAETGAVGQVTHNTARDEWPAWAPDGPWLACSSDRDGDMDIYLFTTEGRNVVHWTNDPGYEEQPAFSPDGQWIAYVGKTQDTDGDGVLERRDDGDFGNVWIGGRDGSQFSQLTYDNASGDPAWSPDGRYIVFTHARDTTGDGYVGLDDASDLWAIPASGGEPMVITEGRNEIGLPIGRGDVVKRLSTNGGGDGIGSRLQADVTGAGLKVLRYEVTNRLKAGC